VAEVIFQIPEEIISQVNYFLVTGPETAPDMSQGECKTYFDLGYHVAQTILYEKA
jgi:hypothetical protein